MGLGERGEQKANALLGNLSTKIFHANNDSVTNNWAAETIGKVFKRMGSISIGQQNSTGISEQLNYQVQPEEFTTLKNGGEVNRLVVEGVVTTAGKKWADGKNFQYIEFNQAH